MKKCILVLLVLISFHVKGDIIFFPFSKDFCSFSLEGIYSLENIISKRNTISYWCGGGIVGDLYYPQNHAEGIEGGIELRRYFKKDSYKRMNLGLYVGSALMVTNSQSYEITKPQYYLGLIPGLKLTYKINLYKKLHLEPYLSASMPIYQNLTDNNDSNPIAGIFTIGARICIIKFKINTKQ
jgi:hypothetical protein